MVVTVKKKTSSFSQISNNNEEEEEIMTALEEILPAEYGFVVLVAVCSMFLLSWMAYKVMAARKKYDVQVKIVITFFFLFKFFSVFI